MHSLTDDGNSLRFLEQHGEMVLYDHALGWLVWNGKVWEQSEEMALSLAIETARSIGIEASAIEDEDLQERVGKWAKSSLSAGHIKAILELGRAHLCKNGVEQNPWLLNTQNFTLDLQLLKRRAHDPADHITQICNVEYDPDATCERWELFIDEITAGDKQLGFTLQQIAGYSLTGLTSERALYVLYGTGDNGKSIFLKTLGWIMGSYSCVAPMHTFASYQHSQSTNDIAYLRDKRLVLSSESESGAKLKEAMVKSMTGDEPITARFLYHDNFTFMPEFKVLLATNHKPEIRGSDKAIWNRVRLLPFTVTIERENQDPKLFLKLKDEGPGILNWMIDGLGAWIAQDLRISYATKVLEATADYRADEDRIGQFLAMAVWPYDNGQVPVAKLYKVYKAWSIETGLRPMPSSTLSVLLKERGLKPTRTKYERLWDGLELTTEANEFLKKPEKGGLFDDR